MYFTSGRKVLSFSFPHFDTSALSYTNNTEPDAVDQNQDKLLGLPFLSFFPFSSSIFMLSKLGRRG